MRGMSFRAGQYGKSVISNERSKEDIDIKKLIFLLKIIFTVLFLFVGAEFMFFKFLHPAVGNPSIKISGCCTFTPEEIVRYVRDLGVKNWFDFNVREAVRVLSAVEGIESVKARKVFPNKIYIDITEREGVALIFLQNDGESVPYEIDAKGMLFKVGNTKHLSYLPIVSGIPLETVGNFLRVEGKFRPLVNQIASVSRKHAKYFSLISEILVLPKEYGNYELELFPYTAKIRVLMDRSLSEEALKNLMIVLDVVTKLDKDVSEVDLRYGSVSYKRR